MDNKKIILLVEIESSTYADEKMTLEKLGYTVIASSDSEHATDTPLKTAYTLYSEYEALKEREEKYRLAFALSPESININAMNGEYIDINDGFTVLTGYTRQDVIGVLSSDIKIWNNPEDREKLIHGLTNDGKVDNLESVFRCKDGSLKTALMSARIVKIKNVPHILSITNDITERKNAEINIKEKNIELDAANKDISAAMEEMEAANEELIATSRELQVKEQELRKSESRYRVLVDLAVDGILLGSHEGIIIDANECMCTIVGMQKDEIIGRHINFLPFSKDSLDKSPLRFDKLKKGEIVLSERVLMHSDGSETAVEMRTKMMPDGTYQSIYRDISQRKKSEEEKAKLQTQLQQAQKMESVGRLAGGVAHDFNNMLGVILGYTELAMMQKDLPTDLHSYLSEINKAAERSGDLTRQLLAFARNQAVAPRVLDLNETVKGMLKMLERLIGEDIDLVWTPANDLWPVSIDPSQVDQILANLCINARDAITDIGKITIETGNRIFDEIESEDYEGLIPGEYVRFTVRDDGCGIDKETRMHIFEPFYTTKVTSKGTGLGLSTVYGAVKQNNGFIHVDSEPDFGTAFLIYLPRYKGAAAVQHADDAAILPVHGHEMILLVEDEQPILHVTTKMLELQGYTVLPAGTHDEALRLAVEHGAEIHLLMSDVIMPGMNGRDLADKIMVHCPHVKTLFMSGYMANIIARKGLLDEGVHFIQKPFTIKELADKIRKTLDEKNF